MISKEYALTSYSTTSILWEFMKLVKMLIQMDTRPKIGEICNYNSTSNYMYEGYSERNLQWAVNKTSNVKKILS
jgi:hypothetical protein